MILTLALRNLFHDRIRLGVTLVGILFAVVLVAVQLGLYAGTSKMIISMVHQAKGELWIVPYGADSFEGSGVLTGSERHAALSTPGVARAIPIVASFSKWQRPQGGEQLCVIVGVDAADGGLVPWNIVAGSTEALKLPDAVAIDRTYYKDLGVTGLNSTAEVRGSRVRVTALTHGIRSFTTTPYIFTTLNRGRSILKLPPDAATFYLIQLQEGADQGVVQAALAKRLPDVEVITKAEMKRRSIAHWLFGTGAGAALIGGAILGVLVGTVIVAQTLYSSTKDHLNEFATLRALGSSSGYIHKVILAQAALSAILGYVLGMSIAMTVVAISVDTSFPIIMTPQLAFGLFVLTLVMCAASATGAIMKVMKLDPAMVFNR
ncbi:MAG: putative ABC transport system permease protein [Hyphomicrobiaceae bacterium]|jgi:putative ABC transport system permease protein